MPEQQKGSRWVAIVTGAISVAIGVLYLLLITVLDARGPMRPPPAEALGGGEVAPLTTAEAAQPLASLHWLEIAEVTVPAC